MNLVTQKCALVCLVVMAAAVTAASPKALAADYSVAYALAANGKTETGKLESCNSIDTCRVKFQTMDATANLSYFSRAVGGDKIVLSMWGDSVCCYFNDGNDSISLDPTARLHAVTIYAGHARRANEVVRNQKLGVLYLPFGPSR
jgi:hypothetical protein